MPKAAAAPSPKDIDSYYRAAFVGLLALDAGAGRFGAAADHHWERFRGELRPADRIDLLLRDLAMDHPAAFAPRELFSIPGLPPDEPFGPDWPGPSARLAEELLRTTTIGPPSGHALLQHVADLWSLTPAPPDPSLLARVQPATRIHAAGAGAVLALYTLCAERRELDLADQTLLCADHPGTRQLFGLARALLAGTRPARVVPSGAAIAEPATLVLISPDASPEEQATLGGAR